MYKNTTTQWKLQILKVETSFIILIVFNGLKKNEAFVLRIN